MGINSVTVLCILILRERKYDEVIVRGKDINVTANEQNFQIRNYTQDLEVFAFGNEHGLLYETVVLAFCDDCTGIRCEKRYFVVRFSVL